MNWTGLLGAAVMGVSLAVLIDGEKSASRGLGQDPLPEEEGDPGVAAGAPSGGGGTGGGGGGPGPVGVVAGAPAGGPAGPSGGPGPVGVVGGAPMPAPAPIPAGGFPGIFPTAGPATSLFFGGGLGWWGWPYPYPAYQRPRQWQCRWETTPPKEDTPLVCSEIRPSYPVAWGRPGWGFW